MNCDCPLCGANLSRRRLKKVPLHGESSWLVFRWFLECPACTGALLFGVKTPLLLALLSMALVAFGPFIGRALVVPADWPRYAPLTSRERKA